MTSFSLDTSFVLRILTESPDSQLPTALSFYEEQRQSGNPLFISDLVLSIERIAILPPHLASSIAIQTRVSTQTGNPTQTPET